MRIAVAGGTGTAGRYVVGATKAAGHEVVVLSRAAGVDLTGDDGLEEALAGVEAIVDATSPPSTRASTAQSFFEDVAARLQRVGHRSGVQRLVVLSIVGIDRVPGFGYYAAKVRQEAVARDGPLSVTTVRATQFHEFAAQVVAQTRKGSFAVVPVMRSQPVAARALGEVLADVATRPPQDAMFEVAGPREEDIVALARTVIRSRGRRIMVSPLHLPGATGRAFRDGALLPDAGARIVGPAYSDWLATADSAWPPL
ncbi:MAG: SDR family oxidoreductase [Actinomycetota bacterium]|nr:SDR family oxidoreductase [Actinomycetota bacterium]